MSNPLSSHSSWSGIPATSWSAALSTVTNDPSIKEIELATKWEDTRFYIGRVGDRYIRRIVRAPYEVLQEFLDVPIVTPPRKNPIFTEPPPILRRGINGRRTSYESESNFPSPIPHEMAFCEGCDEDMDGLRVGNLCAPCWQEKCGVEEEECDDQDEYQYDEDQYQDQDQNQEDQNQDEQWYFHTPPLPSRLDLYHPHTLLQFFRFISSVNMYGKDEHSTYFFDPIPKSLADEMMDHPWIKGIPSENDDWNRDPATDAEVIELTNYLSDYTE
jgi:hypothetical protein